MRLIQSVCLLLPFACCAAALAERPAQDRKEASHVVVGTVERVFQSDRGPELGYIVAIRIEKLEKGNGYEDGDVFYAYCFQRKRNAPRVPSASGHRAVPRPEQRIRAFVNRQYGEMEGVYPNWFDVLKQE